MRFFRPTPPDPAAARLAVALRPEARAISGAARLSTLAALIWLGMAASVAMVFSTLVAGTASPWIILAGAGAFLGLGAVRAGLTIRANDRLEVAADRILGEERAALTRAQDRVSPRATGRVTSAEIAALMVDKLPHLRPYILRHKPAALRATVVPLTILLVAFSLSWAVGLVLLVAGPLIPVFMALVGMAAREASEKQMDEIGSLSSLLSERLGALLDIRVLDARTRMLEDFDTRAENLRERTMAVLRVAFLSSTVLELFSAIGVAMVAVYVGFALLGELGFGAWATPLTLAEGVFLLMLAPEFFQPLRDLAAAWHDKAAALAVARDLNAVEAAEEAEILGEGGAAAGAQPLAGPIRLEGLGLGTMDYPDLEIAPGETLAFTGPSGSGKSTLIALIGGLVAAERGTIEVGAQQITPESADAWRAHVTWVPQSPYFQPGPLRDSLTLGLPQPSATTMAEALSLSAASGVVARLPEGLETRLGESGAGVSGGEARRLMLTRAALSHRPVLLADEPTADLDAETAAEITGALTRLAAQGTTVIVATHDPALAAAMDRRVDLSPLRLEQSA